MERRSRMTDIYDSELSLGNESIKGFSLFTFRL